MVPMRAVRRQAPAHAVAAGERRRSGVAYNPLFDRMAQDPCPVHAAMRRLSPVHRSRLPDAWLFTRHADGDAAERHHRNFANDPPPGGSRRVTCEFCMVGRAQEGSDPRHNRHYGPSAGSWSEEVTVWRLEISCHTMLGAKTGRNCRLG